MPDRVDTLIEPVESPHFYAPVSRSAVDPYGLQLPERHQSVLAGRYPGDFTVPISSTGRYVKVTLTYRPVGGGGLGGHAPRVKDGDACVVR
jgi:hypothetical protein